MNAEIFGEWLRRQGHRIYKSESCYWYDAKPARSSIFPLPLVDPAIPPRNSKPAVEEEHPRPALLQHLSILQPAWSVIMWCWMTPIIALKN